MNSNNSKSTPLSQLPSPQQQAPNSQFVNEQHRQIVAQAQVAAQNFTMPQTTSGGVSSTEDADIQEALALVTGAVPASSEAQGQGPHQQQQMMQQHQHQQQQQELAELNALRQQQHAAMQAQMQLQAQMQQLQQQQQQQQIQQQPPQQQSPAHAPRSGASASPFSLPDTDEIRLVLLGISTFILVTLLPMSDLLARFIPALEGIPYSDVLVRALLLGIALFVGQRAMVYAQ